MALAPVPEHARAILFADDPRSRPADHFLAVLGMLSHAEELSGYDLKKWADWNLQ
ncbi:hypothetical protein GCM10027089_11080 [Nocardia thraciensis]